MVKKVSVNSNQHSEIAKQQRGHGAADHSRPQLAVRLLHVREHEQQLALVHRIGCGEVQRAEEGQQRCDAAVGHENHQH